MARLRHAGPMNVGFRGQSGNGLDIAKLTRLTLNGHENRIRPSRRSFRLSVWTCNKFIYGNVGGFRPRFSAAPQTVHVASPVWDQRKNSWALAVANPRSQAHIPRMVTIVQCNCGAEYRRTEEKFLVPHAISEAPSVKNLG